MKEGGLWGAVGLAAAFMLRWRRMKQRPNRHDLEAQERKQLFRRLPRAKPAIHVRRATDERVNEILQGASGGSKQGSKVVHFIRHGQGYHNVAQKDWYAADKPGVPYTLDHDPDLAKFGDAELTPVGIAQANALQAKTESLRPALLVVSPMRRAAHTGLLAFEAHVARGLPVLAMELCHEIAGKHTCDRRLSKTALAAAFPKVDFSLIRHEEDPYWGDGVTRESFEALATRAADFLRWLGEREETHVAVATHSAFLHALFNAALTVDDPEDDDEITAYFATGEMRSVVLNFAPAGAT